jgi:RNA recognition motif-containing protein
VPQRTSRPVNPVAVFVRSWLAAVIRIACRNPGVSPKGECVLSKKLYVGNLPFETTSDELRELFTPHGRVTSATICSDRETGRSRGFAFVEMTEGTDEAIQALNQTQFGGRSLTVNEAKPREERPRTGGGMRGGY